jgi:hypothetical protein
MRLDEISDEDKSFLTLRGIKFEFIDDYNNIISALSIIGKSNSRKQLLHNDIDLLSAFISVFLNQGFNESDPEIINAKNLYNKLLEIKNQL